MPEEEPLNFSDLMPVDMCKKTFLDLIYATLCERGFGAALALDDPVILHFLQAELHMNYWLERCGGYIGAVFGDDDRFAVEGDRVRLRKELKNLTNFGSGPAYFEPPPPPMAPNFGAGAEKSLQKFLEFDRTAVEPDPWQKIRRPLWEPESHLVGSSNFSTAISAVGPGTSAVFEVNRENFGEIRSDRIPSANSRQISASAVGPGTRTIAGDVGNFGEIRSNLISSANSRQISALAVGPGTSANEENLGEIRISSSSGANSKKISALAKISASIRRSIEEVLPDLRMTDDEIGKFIHDYWLKNGVKGMKRHELASAIIRTIIEAKQLDNECPICLEEIQNDQWIYNAMQCKHKLHESCMKNWLKQRSAQTCPVCQVELLAGGEYPPL